MFNWSLKTTETSFLFHFSLCHTHFSPARSAEHVHHTIAEANWWFNGKNRKKSKDNRLLWKRRGGHLLVHNVPKYAAVWTATKAKHQNHTFCFKETQQSKISPISWTSSFNGLLQNSGTNSEFRSGSAGSQSLAIKHSLLNKEFVVNRAPKYLTILMQVNQLNLFN